MRSHCFFAGVLLYALSSGAAAVADPASVSIQDLRPECKERHSALPPEQCVIDDRMARLDYARRFGGGAVIIVEPALLAPAAAAPSAPRENIIAPTAR